MRINLSSNRDYLRCDPAVCLFINLLRNLIYTFIYMLHHIHVIRPSTLCFVIRHSFMFTVMSKIIPCMSPWGKYRFIIIVVFQHSLLIYYLFTKIFSIFMIFYAFLFAWDVAFDKLLLLSLIACARNAKFIVKFYSS